MQISARRALWYESDQRLEIEGLTFITYDTENGSVSSSGEADRAVLYEASGDAEFSGYVCVRSAEGDVSFETQRSRTDGLSTYSKPPTTSMSS